MPVSLRLRPFIVIVRAEGMIVRVIELSIRQALRIFHIQISFIYPKAFVQERGLALRQALKSG